MLLTDSVSASGSSSSTSRYLRLRDGARCRKDHQDGCSVSSGCSYHTDGVEDAHQLKNVLQFYKILWEGDLRKRKRDKRPYSFLPSLFSSASYERSVGTCRRNVAVALQMAYRSAYHQGQYCHERTPEHTVGHIAQEPPRTPVTINTQP